MSLFDVCVVGGGPSGSAAAWRLAESGRRVCLIEAKTFPRQQVGESLAPSIFPLLEEMKLTEKIENAPFVRSDAALVHWESDDPIEKSYLPGFGWQVDRGPFDQWLLQHASSGIELIQPYRVRSASNKGSEWELSLSNKKKSMTVRARFLIDATGRASRLLRQPWDHRAVPMLALYAYWENTFFLDHVTRIDCSDNGWFWAAPLADGRANIAAFVDPEKIKNRNGMSLIQLYQNLLQGVPLMEPGLSGQMATPVYVCNASSKVCREVIGHNWIKVGESALTLDPLSSQGVQTAIRTGLQGAVVAHTLLTKPQRTRVARSFYCVRIRETIRRHRETTRELYGRQKRFPDSAFWRRRSISSPEPPVQQKPAVPDFSGRWRLARNARIETVPALRGDLIEEVPGLIHPNLDRPVAFISEVPVRDLLELLRQERTWPEIGRIWHRFLPFQRRYELALWLQQNGILNRI